MKSIAKKIMKTDAKRSTSSLSEKSTPEKTSRTRPNTRIIKTNRHKERFKYHFAPTETPVQANTGLKYELISLKINQRTNLEKCSAEWSSDIEREVTLHFTRPDLIERSV